MVTTKEELYSVLLSLRTTYREKLEQMIAASVLDISGAGYTNHQADDATMVYDQTASASACHATKDRLQQVEIAIQRYESGSYGVCEHCGQEIDIARLEAIPYTPFCLRCAETLEYRAGM